jgi:DNA-directed RNA polymerase specialized sigma24 family protein
MSVSKTCITPELNEIMSFLSFTFAKSIHDPAQSKEDLYQDLVVVYLEKNQNFIKITALKHWFIVFKNYLLDKYKRRLIECKALNNISNELNQELKKLEF